MQNVLPYTQHRISVVRNKQTYKNLFYLSFSFFLSIFFFSFVLTGLLVGIGTLIVWLGVPILFGTVLLWWQLAALERSLAIYWLGIVISPMGTMRPEKKGWWPTFQIRLSSMMTWKTLAYLCLKFPLGIFSFSFTLVLSLLTVTLLIVGSVLGFCTAPFFALVVALTGTPDPGQRVRRYLWLSVSCLGFCPLCLTTINGLAWLHGQIARTMLGMSESALRLDTARILADKERQRAELADQRRHELVANVSHELRAPVANIAGHLESLLLATEEGTRLPAPRTLQNYLHIAYQEAQRLSQLVDELLSLARMESNELALDIQEVVASEVVEEVYQMLMPLALRERQVTLVRGSQPHLSSVYVDRRRLIQILQNLVRNAIASTPAQGIVSISLEYADERHLALVVEDNGVGIPPEELARIFERFYRTDASRSRATGGFGLGLAVVHDLVGAMGGSVAVTSAVGQGTRFQVLLPSGAPVGALLP